VVVPQVPPCRPGQFYLRELPPLRAVLGRLTGLGLLVVDGYAGLDPGGRPGPGTHAHADFGVPVIGVATSRLRTATHAVPVLHRSSARPLFISAAGMPAVDVAELAQYGTGRHRLPMDCATPVLPRGQGRPH
jgi:deoxyribonuclease V